MNAALDAPPQPFDQRITKLALPENRKVMRFSLIQTPSADLSLYAVADDGTLWWVAAPERRLAGRWLSVTDGGPFTRITFRSTPNGFGSLYDAEGTAPAPGCRAPRCAAKAGESGEYAVHGDSLVLSGRDRTIPDTYHFELTPSELMLQSGATPTTFKLIRACDSSEACESFGLSRPPGKGNWRCDQERCFWIGADAPPKKKGKSAGSH